MSPAMVDVAVPETVSCPPAERLPENVPAPKLISPVMDDAVIDPPVIVGDEMVGDEREFIRWESAIELKFELF